MQQGILYHTCYLKSTIFQYDERILLIKLIFQSHYQISYCIKDKKAIYLRYFIMNVNPIRIY